MKIDVEKIISWFHQNKRDLPWRKTIDPYAIWISEIMLQQTRAEAVKPYYERFIKEVPTIQDLAQIEEDRLLKLWEGLGYYSRARNLQIAAQCIQNKYHGIFPKTYEDVLFLKGIGDYTAGAILSRAFHLPYAAVDGNVLRLLTRYEASDKDIALESTKKYYKKKVETLTPSDFGALNEAFMELGATICTPKIARCSLCPLNHQCQSYQTNSMYLYPVKTKKVKVAEYESTCLFFYDENEKVYFEKKDTSVLKGLWMPYRIEDSLSIHDVYSYLDDLQIEYQNIVELQDQKHVFTHQIWYMKGYQVFLKKTPNWKGSFYSVEEVKKKISVATCFQKFFKELGLK